MRLLKIQQKILPVLGLFLLLNHALFAQKKVQWKVRVTPSETMLEVGETVQFTAKLVDKSGIEKDTTFLWSVSGNGVGLVDGDGLFTAQRPGNAHVVASAGRLSGKASVSVQRDSLWGVWRVVIVPSDTVLIPGESVPFTAFLEDSTGAVKDTTFQWSVDDPDVATLDAEAVLTAHERGHTFVHASVGALSGKAHVTVARDTLAWQWLKSLKVLVSPGDTLVAPGSTLTYSAVLVDSSGQAIDTTFSWSADGDIGVMDENGLLTAGEEKAQGFVYATVGSISGKSHVVVNDTTGNAEGREEGVRLVIVPADTAVAIGETVQYAVQLVDSLGNVVDTTTTEWQMRGRIVGSLTADGFFTATNRGMGLVKARLGRYVATTHVMVAHAQDLAGGDSVKVKFKHRDGVGVGNLVSKAEKDVLKIGGLPFPLNMLNGGELAFPPGSLTEDIAIEITIPSQTLVGDSTVSFADEILSGIAFHVYVNDTLVSPYYFDDPVGLTLPYKPDLMAELGLNVEDLWLYFYNDSTGYTDNGITNVVLDTANHVIYGEIAHFSEIMIVSQDCACTDVAPVAALPETHELMSNYPNPFNPSTTIQFRVGGLSTVPVSLTIYNILGQEVRQLTDRVYHPGLHTLNWDGRDHNGRTVGTGIYIYRLTVGDFTETRRMVFAK